MANKLVQFRVNEQEEQWLQSQALPNESLSLTAKRLLFGTQGNQGNQADYAKDDIKQQLDELVRERFDNIQANAQTLKDEAIQVMEQFDQKLEEGIKRATETSVAFIDRQIDKALAPIWERLNELTSSVIPSRSIEVEPKTEAIESTDSTVKGDEFLKTERGNNPPNEPNPSELNSSPQTALDDLKTSPEAMSDNQGIVTTPQQALMSHITPTTHFTTYALSKLFGMTRSKVVKLTAEELASKGFKKVIEEGGKIHYEAITPINPLPDA